jgi:hydroxymethylbilane synthase
MATLDDNSLTLEGMVASLDGSVVFREIIRGDAVRAESLGIRLADKLIEKGARKLLDQTRADIEPGEVSRKQNIG